MSSSKSAHENKDDLQDCLKTLRPLLDDFSRNTYDDLTDHGTLIRALQQTRNQVERCTLTRKSKAAKRKDGGGDIATKQEVDEMGVRIWNLTSDYKHSVASKPKDIGLVASLYHTAFRLIEASTEPNPPFELTARLLRACSAAIPFLAQSGQLELAEELTHLGAEYQQILTASKLSSTEENRERNHVLSTFLLARVDLEISRKNDNLALSLMMKAAEFDVMGGSKYQELVTKCWSISHDLIARKKQANQIPFTTAPIEWLQQGIAIIEKMRKIGLNTPTVEDIHITILQSIAQEQISNAPKDPNYLPKAMKTLNEIVKIGHPIDGLTAYQSRMVQIHLLSRERKPTNENGIRDVLIGLIENIEWSEDQINEIFAQAQVLAEHYPILPLWICQSLLDAACGKEEGGEDHLSRILYEGIIIARQSLVGQSQAGYNAVSSMLETIVKNSSQRHLDEIGIAAIQLILNEVAEKSFENQGKLDEAAQWYLLAAHPALPSGKPERANQCRRKAALCLVRAGKLIAAKELLRGFPLEEASTHYLAFLIATEENDFAEASSAIDQLMECRDVEAGHLLLISTLSNKEGRETFMLDTLQSLLDALERPDVEDSLRVERLTLIKCMVRITVAQLANKSAEKDIVGNEVVGLLDSAIRSLRGDTPLNQEHAKTVSWLYKSAYNLGVAELGNFSAGVLSKLFDRSAQLIDWYRRLDPADVDSNMEKTRALTMFACFCGKAFQYRDLPDGNEKFTLRNQLLQYYHAVHKALSSADGGPNTMKDLLEVYRIELLCNAHRWEEIRGTIITLKSSDRTDNDATIRILEMVANLLLDYPDCPTSIIHHLLQAIIGLCGITNQAEVVRFSRWIRGIITLLFIRNTPEDLARAQDYFSRTLKILRTPLGREYPQDEFHWLIATTWNKGLAEYGSSRMESASKWCRIALTIAETMPGSVSQSQEMKRQYLEMFGQNTQ
ncbi:hypothetical protein I302_108019 [Kwoniella bestiolae CBS 10118]|uniref:Protein ZIP4 homolog n=1 Tax=Kwoniella bestiolae CBS 10118 TaxID=1296100 RepID=A0A1B9FWX6_9TREE|nr:hypothetical protein I302_07615 [Kwoniella bestiolae CBS 10118]OCF23261.1 hypothetical protein I302_07615 [Kwoniella bestiolae CBS 10118]